VKVACPTCGAEVEFRYDDSFVRVCDSCRAAVVRADRGVETLGKVADLAPTASPLALFADGRYQGQGFMLVGRAQYRHPAGGIWDEWYAKMDDGRWGWLAEAQGRFYLTFETLGAGDPPSWDEVFPGASVQLEDDGIKLFTVGERGVAELAAAAGEIPFRFIPGQRSAFADLADGTGRFATIDYGDPEPAASGTADDPVNVYIGRQVSLAELGLAGGEAPERAAARPAAGQALACPSCGGAIELRAPDRSLRVVCPYCSTMLDCEGPLAVLEKLAQPPNERGTIPLGSKGTFDGVTYTLIGRLRREVTYDGSIYLWDELLLYEPAVGFRWLVESNGHWSFVTTLPPGAVDGGLGDSPTYRGTSFRLFDASTAEVSGVWGEMYWRVEVGERTDNADYVAPPAMLSREVTDDEINWSLGIYQTPAQIRAAFGLKDPLPPLEGVGPHQPFKHRHAYQVLIGLGIAFVGLTCARAGMADETVALDTSLQLEQPPAEAVPPELTGANIPLIVFSEPFKLVGDQNVEVKIALDVDQSWAFVGADLVNEVSGDVFSFESEVSYYSGFEGGESWSEGSRSSTHFLPAVKPGSYVLRLEVQQPLLGRQDRVHVRVRQDVFRWRHALYVLILLGIPGLLLGAWAWSFERRRWKDSDHGP
jgi:hypothetical protein